MPELRSEMLVFTQQEMYDLSEPLMRIMRRAQVGASNFPEVIEPFKNTGSIKIDDKDVRLLDIRVIFGSGIFVNYLNVIAVASAANQLSIIKYLHENKNALHIHSSEFSAAWLPNGRRSFVISEEIYDYLTKDEELVEFIKQEFPPEFGLLREEEPQSSLSL